MKLILFLVIGSATIDCCLSDIPRLFTTTFRTPGNSKHEFQFQALKDSVKVSHVKHATNELRGSFNIRFGHSAGEPEMCRTEASVSQKSCKGQHCHEYERRAVACLQWSRHDRTVSRIEIRNKVNRDNSTNHDVFKISLIHRNVESDLSVCFPLGSEMLYGGSVANAYPSQNIIKDEAPFVTGEGDISKVSQWTGAVAERKWITSGGRGIHVKPGSPLFVTQNSSDLCLSVSNRPPYSEVSTVLLEYDFCLTKNAKEAWQCLNSERSKAPLPPESEYILKEPIWSTWVAYKTNISQQTVMDFAASIKKYGLRMGVMEIDDKWETCYGSQLINTTTFPNAKQMVEDLHKMGAKVTFWVHPFVNVDCSSFQQLQEHLFAYPNGTVGVTTWWNGQAGLVNFLQQNTYEFFTERLKTFKKDYGVDGFKFDAGEAYYIPGLFQFTPLNYPNEYTNTYVKLAASFGQTTEVRVGADSASMDLFQRLQDTNSDWTLNNYGLKSVITSSLQLSILGFRAIMPDMVGGNCYGPPPDKELFIRWVQLTTFLPVMQFSYHPWNFDKETIDITKRYIDLHYNYSSRMVNIFNTAEVPLISPVWWLDPDNPVALRTTDQFLVGDEILVAPVVDKGTYSRSVFIPSGNWTDANNGQPIKGPLIIPEYPAPIEKLPYFIRLKS
ncbi:hypothetical protein GE061_002349 [Apolygus lucorum]|uniref:Glycoside hydrolase family 31 N-terminal domain-containing protein n=1 Tax=Apolygus lucorum TaxID=248454 RepID=A0A6A4JLA0_APOLU|nr:hypothetical protein GE061_002349 [Apolygus lucorum]